MKTIPLLIIVAVLAGTAGCNQDDTIAAAAPPESATQAKNIVSTSGQPEIVVYKSPTCGCCSEWVEHLQTHGFPVKVSDVENMAPIKEQAGVPPGLGSCHTAKVDNYFIEGHVPAADIQRLLAEKPQAKGLAVPGMPIGSPGMEQGDRVDPYEVLLVHDDGSTTVFARHPAEQ